MFRETGARSFNHIIARLSLKFYHFISVLPLNHITLVIYLSITSNNSREPYNSFSVLHRILIRLTISSSESISTVLIWGAGCAGAGGGDSPAISASISCSSCTKHGASIPCRAPRRATSSRHSTTLRGFLRNTAGQQRKKTVKMQQKKTVRTKDQNG